MSIGNNTYWIIVLSVGRAVASQAMLQPNDKRRAEKYTTQEFAEKAARRRQEDDTNPLHRYWAVEVKG